MFTFKLLLLPSLLWLSLNMVIDGAVNVGNLVVATSSIFSIERSQRIKV